MSFRYREQWQIKKADINISQNGGEGDMLLPISLGVYRSPRILSLLELHSTFAFL